jgi:serine/threonine protein kinase
MNASSDFGCSHDTLGTGLARSEASEGITVDLGAHQAAGASQDGPQPESRQVAVKRVLRDRYEIEGCLGTGGRGTVFRAFDRYRSSMPAPHRHVAIKILHDSGGDREETIEALRRELQSAQTLSHPNIVKVYDVDRDGDIDFFTMELLDGELLSNLMRRFQPLPMPREHAWAIIRQIASGLEHAHTRKLVHADLKPQNIMVTNSGEVRILDFGSSYRFNKEAQNEPWRGSSFSTPAYACCELLDGRVPDPRDDLYALSCIAYELLTGAHPFQRRRASEARDYGVVAARPSGLSRRQWQMLSKGLSWHRAGRSISVGDWYKGMKPSSDDAKPLADIADLKPVPLRTPGAPPLRPFAVVSVLLCMAAISLLFVRLAPGGKVTGAPLTSPAAYERMARASHLAATSSPNTSTSLAVAAIPAQPQPNPGAGMMPVEYHVQPGQHFAEIRVHRPAHARRNEALTWWTEPASAKAGVDYVGQPKVSQPFPKSGNSMSVFVKLLPKAKRTQPEVFYVAVADKSDKRSDQIAVRLPPSGNSF